MRYDLGEVSNTRISEVIDEWVRGERDRAIMKRRLIDKIRFEPLAEEFDLSTTHVMLIFSKNIDVIRKHL